MVGAEFSCNHKEIQCISKLIKCYSTDTLRVEKDIVCPEFVTFCISFVLSFNSELCGTFTLQAG